ncbi:MAG: TfoX/Sxy family protein [Chloroflexota bacterium]|nr:TfoX/Sxy family protein [Chloroflexota bacterium]
MFGGLAFLVDGKMCVGVLKNELVVRVGAERYMDALKRPHARPMDFTGRPSRGMVYVSAAGVTRGAALKRWVDAGVTAAHAAPARRRPATPAARPSPSQRPGRHRAGGAR